MVRTLINLDPDDKAWLDREAEARKLPMTELVRQAVRGYRIRHESHGLTDLQAALRRTAGIWQHGDGLHYQHRLRDEWNDRG
ncbi:MAG: ribbon-helix-helix protein, CopG family [Rhodanobacter sp.]|nr:MAG: ribbon-helix-helix protein, CopG family [Rhodanobacter sp.]